MCIRDRAYSEAVESSIVRTNRAVLDGGTKTEQINFCLLYTSRCV